MIGKNILNLFTTNSFSILNPHIRGVLFIEFLINLIGGIMQKFIICFCLIQISFSQINPGEVIWEENFDNLDNWIIETGNGSWGWGCLLYTSPSPRDKRQSRMPSSA